MDHDVFRNSVVRSLSVAPPFITEAIPTKLLTATELEQKEREAVHERKMAELARREREQYGVHGLNSAGGSACVSRGGGTPSRGGGGSISGFNSHRSSSSNHKNNHSNRSNSNNNNNNNSNHNSNHSNNNYNGSGTGLGDVLARSAGKGGYIGGGGYDSALSTYRSTEDQYTYRSVDSFDNDSIGGASLQSLSTLGTTQLINPTRLIYPINKPTLLTHHIDIPYQ